jgi:hypothetical protein
MIVMIAAAADNEGTMVNNGNNNYNLVACALKLDLYTQAITYIGYKIDRLIDLIRKATLLILFPVQNAIFVQLVT